MKQGVHAENSDSNDDDDNSAYGDADFDFADNGDCSDYKYNPVNFLGLNICVLGSLIYTKVNFFFAMLLLFYKTSISIRFLWILQNFLTGDFHWEKAKCSTKSLSYV